MDVCEACGHELQGTPVVCPGCGRFRAPGREGGRSARHAVAERIDPVRPGAAPSSVINGSPAAPTLELDPDSALMQRRSSGLAFTAVVPPPNPPMPSAAPPAVVATLPPPPRQVADPTFGDEPQSSREPVYVPFAVPGRRRTRGWAWATLTALLVLALAGGAYHVVQQRSGNGGAPRAVGLPVLSLGSARPVSPAAAANHPATGVAYRSAAGHFSARFATTPVETATQVSVGAISMSARVAADQAALTEVAAVKVNTGLPADQETSFMAGLLDGIAHSSPTLTEQPARPTTFHGHSARQANYVSTTGVRLTALVSVYSSTWTYLFLAPTGPSFTQLTGSFAPTP